MTFQKQHFITIFLLFFSQISSPLESKIWIIQMVTSHLCSLVKHSAPWMGAVAVLVTFATFFFYILLFLFFTCLFLILSTSVLFTLSKKSKVFVKKTVQKHEVLVSTDRSRLNILKTATDDDCREGNLSYFGQNCR